MSLASCFRKAIVVFVLSISTTAGAFNDPTGGKPFFKWLWNDQYIPTFKTVEEKGSIFLLTGGIFASAVSFQYDKDVYKENHHNQKMSKDLSAVGSQIGSGMPGIAIAALQIAFDQENGLAHARAISLTSATHITIAVAARRDRPNHKARLSFPSGHTSSAFASATSLAYAYGWLVGVPAFTAAGIVMSSKWADNQHWFSDTVAGAFLGYYWARASWRSKKYREKNPGESHVEFYPVPIDGGGYLSVSWDF